METNYGTRKNPLQRFSFAKISSWKVISIEENIETTEVFCATVPDSGRFTLASGILTGNCAFLSTEKISSRNVYDAVMPFTRLMEMSMLGTGVGFDAKGAGKLEIHKPLENENWTFTVPDSREGWAESLSHLLESYFFSNRPTVVFDYSEIRPEGAPIKTFGGIAPGPKPLIQLHENIRKLFKDRENSKITSTDIVDLQNMIGQCVVSGGRRRTAEIAFGDSNDKEFLDLKDYSLNPYRAEWGWASNNSIFAQVGMDYGQLVERIANNGEPGLFYLDLCRDYGRMIDPPNYKDYRNLPF
jgi:hypothetical protein